MITDREQLSPNIYKFRSVKGDGDCFYRGLIFFLFLIECSLATVV